MCVEFVFVLNLDNGILPVPRVNKAHFGFTRAGSARVFAEISNFETIWTHQGANKLYRDIYQINLQGILFLMICDTLNFHGSISSHRRSTLCCRNFDVENLQARIKLCSKGKSFTWLVVKYHEYWWGPSGVVFNLNTTCEKYRGRQCVYSGTGGFTAIFRLYLIKTHISQCENKTKHTYYNSRMYSDSNDVSINNIYWPYMTFVLVWKKRPSDFDFFRSN